jgi:ribonuclease H2 subunit C
VEVKVAEQIGEFDEVVVWGHGGQVEEGQDLFIRGMKEWIGFAEAMHGEEEDESQEENKGN